MTNRFAYISFKALLLIDYVWLHVEGRVRVEVYVDGRVRQGMDVLKASFSPVVLLEDAEFVKANTHVYAHAKPKKPSCAECERIRLGTRLDFPEIVHSRNGYRKNHRDPSVGPYSCTYSVGKYSCV